MPFLFLPFPAFDPILITIGPFAIRWYALAYIVGILFGWLYARALIRAETLWGGPAPLTVIDFDDFVIWVTLGIILGGRTGYVLFYNLPHFAAHPAEIVAAVEGRHVVSRRLHRLRLAVVLFARWRRKISILSLGDLTCAVAPIGLLLGRIANFINGEIVGSPGRRALGYGVSGRRAVAAPSEPALRGRARRAGAVRRALACSCAAGALKRPGLIIGAFAVGYGVARIVCEFFREPDPQLGFLWGGLTMGMLLSVPLMLAGMVFIVAATAASSRWRRA